MTNHFIFDMGAGSLCRKTLAYDCADAHPIFHGLWNDTGVWILECPKPSMPALIVRMDGCPKQVLNAIRKGNGALAYYTALLLDIKYFCECLDEALRHASESGQNELRRQFNELMRS